MKKTFKQNIRVFLVAAVVIFLAYWFLLGGDSLSYDVVSCAGSGCADPFQEGFSPETRVIVAVLLSGIGALIVTAVLSIARKSIYKPG